MCCWWLIMLPFSFHRSVTSLIIKNRENTRRGCGDSRDGFKICLFSVSTEEKIRGRQSSEPLKEDKTNVEQEKLTFWVWYRNCYKNTELGQISWGKCEPKMGGKKRANVTDLCVVYIALNVIYLCVVHIAIECDWFVCSSYSYLMWFICVIYLCVVQIAIECDWFVCSPYSYWTRNDKDNKMDPK